MNKYTWDLEYLLKKKKELIEKVAIYESSLATYNALIACYNKRITHPNKEFQDDLDDNENELFIEEFIEKILPDTNPEALEMLLQTKDLFLQYKWENNTTDFSPCYLNNEQLIEYTISLIDKIPHKTFVNQIKSCVNPNRKLLHIKHSNKLSTNYYGLSFVDFSQRRPYGLVARENNTNDIITLAHELFHMVIKKNLNPLSMNSYNYVYDEVEGYLANFIIRDLLKEEQYPKEELDFIDTQDLWRTGWTVHDSFITNAILTCTDERYKFKLQDVNQYLKEENLKVRLTKQTKNAYFHDKFNEEIVYSFSYLVALDLYELYKQDPEKAIYHLYCLKVLTGQNIEKELDVIDATFHKDDYKNLENKCNQLLKKKTTKK